MLREQFINFLELSLTNAVSILVAAYAIAGMRGSIRRKMQMSEQPVLLKFPSGRVRH